MTIHMISEVDISLEAELIGPTWLQVLAPVDVGVVGGVAIVAGVGVVGGMVVVGVVIKLQISFVTEQALSWPSVSR